MFESYNLILETITKSRRYNQLVEWRQIFPPQKILVSSQSVLRPSVLRKFRSSYLVNYSHLDSSVHLPWECFVADQLLSVACHSEFLQC